MGFHTNSTLFYLPIWRIFIQFNKINILFPGDRLTNAVVRAGKSLDVVTNKQCGQAVTAEQVAKYGGTIDIVCDGQMRARYISVDIPTSQLEILQLCEVTVEEMIPGYC